MKEKEKVSQCETCAYYDYEYETDSFVCTINLDEDEIYSYLSGGHNSCPYYNYYDEYKVVRKQN